MRKELIFSLAGAVLCFAASGSAFAADLNKPVYKAPPPPSAPVWSWTGFYVGGNAGGAWGTFDATTTTVSAPFPSYFGTTDPGQVAAAGVQSIKPSGFTGGFEAGYNFQAGNFVYGLEGDIESFGLSGSATSGPITYFTAPGSAFTVNANASTNWLATARGRVGVAVNNWLFFATGGAAFTTLNGNFTFTDNFDAPPGAHESSSFSDTRAGYTVGGGIEAGFWGHWSFKVEYLYVNFGQISAVSTNLTTSETLGLTAFPQNPFTHTVDLKANIVRVGLNYHFN